MKRYLDGDKTSCQLEKQVLLEALRKKYDACHRKMLECAQTSNEAYNREADYWSVEGEKALIAIDRVVDMDCNDLVPYAKKNGIDLPSEFSSQYSGIMGELKKQIMQTGAGQLFSNLSGAAHVISNIKNYTNSAIGKWNSHIEGLASFSTDFIQTPNGGWIVPWYFDQALGLQYANEIVEGIEPPEDIRIPLIIEYEEGVYEFYLWVLENEGEQALCQYINSFGKNEPENFATNSIPIQIYLAHIFAYQQIEGWEAISMSCIDSNGDLIK